MVKGPVARRKNMFGGGTVGMVKNQTEGTSGSLGKAREKEGGGRVSGRQNSGMPFLYGRAVSENRESDSRKTNCAKKKKRIPWKENGNGRGGKARVCFSGFRSACARSYIREPNREEKEKKSTIICALHKERLTWEKIVLASGGRGIQGFLRKGACANKGDGGFRERSQNWDREAEKRRGGGEGEKRWG